MSCTEWFCFHVCQSNGMSVVDSFGNIDEVVPMSIYLTIWACYCSDDFKNIMERSLRKIADMVIEDLAAQTGIPSPPSGLPLATLLPRVAHLSSPLLEEPNKNKHIQMIRSMPEVELFYTFLYANMPPETWSLCWCGNSTCFWILAPTVWRYVDVEHSANLGTKKNHGESEFSFSAPVYADEIFCCY